MPHLSLPIPLSNEICTTRPTFFIAYHAISSPETSEGRIFSVDAEERPEDRVGLTNLAFTDLRRHMSGHEYRSVTVMASSLLALCVRHPQPKLEVVMNVVRSSLPSIAIDIEPAAERPLSSPQNTTSGGFPLGYGRIDFGTGVITEMRPILYLPNGDDAAMLQPHKGRAFSDPNNKFTYVGLLGGEEILNQGFCS